MVIPCGLIGIPPSNGVIPQSPMHTKSLATLKHQILRNRLVATARKCMGKNASLGQVYGSMQEAYQHMQTPLIYQEPSAQVIPCGLIGIPPSNGVIPQSPMHTKSLATLKHQILRNRLVATARKCMGKNASLGQVYSAHQKITVEDQIVSPIVLKQLKQSTIHMAAGSRHYTVFNIEKEIDDLLPVEVKEQRLTNLLQAIKVGGCVAAMPFVKMIPTS
ncbi:hypothetical protein OIU78_028499 [Salix suchowensis]|nr:hypothetical protein OIU78_028499 [Salix suchowensis]